MLFKFLDDFNLHFCRQIAVELPPTAPSASSLSQGSCVSPRCRFKGITLQKNTPCSPNNQFLLFSFFVISLTKLQDSPIGVHNGMHHSGLDRPECTEAGIPQFGPLTPLHNGI